MTYPAPVPETVVGIVDDAWKRKRTAVAVDVAYICMHPTSSVEVAAFDVVLVALVKVKRWSVVEPLTRRSPALLIVVVAEPPIERAFEVRAEPKNALVVVAEVVVELPVTVRFPSVAMFVLIVVTALAMSETTKTPNITARTTEIILVILSLLIKFIFNFYYCY